MPLENSQTSLLDKAAPAINFATTRIVRRLSGLVLVENYPTPFLPQFNGLIADAQVPILYGNHLSHIDPVAYAVAGTELIKQAELNDQEANLNGFVMGVASSVPSGHQNKLMKVTYGAFSGVMKEFDLTLVPVTRPKDTREFHIVKNGAELRPFISGLKSGSGIITLPEASVQGGRHSKQTGEVFGLQNVTNNVLAQMVDLVSRVKRNGTEPEPFFQPFGIMGSQDLHSSDELRPTVPGLVSLFEIPSNVLSMFGFEKRFIKGKFGQPITMDMLKDELGSDWRRDNVALNRFLMSRVAALVLPKYQGVFS